MQITGIEVIRERPRVAGPVRSARPRVIGAVPGEKLQLTYGDALRINAGFDYRGHAEEVTFYGAIGKRGMISFDEIIHAEAGISLPDSRVNFVPITASVDIPITGDIAPAENYDIYCKIKEFTGAGLPEVDDCIDITGIPPSYELLEETIYPFAYIYDGPHEGGTFTFKTDPLTPSSWVAGRLAARCEEEVRKEGGKLLEMRVYVDKSPLLWSDWRIEVVTTPPKTTAKGLALSLGIAWWAIAILAALAIILIIVITWAAKEIAGLFTHKPGLEEVKPAWQKDTLISTIQDAEEYWERTPTPVETLEGMSEEELRDYLDNIAEEEVPPTEGIGLGLVVAGVAVAGLGALALVGMAMAKPKETRG